MLARPKYDFLELILPTTVLIFFTFVSAQYFIRLVQDYIIYMLLYS